jgi:hypothetical protein
MLSHLPRLPFLNPKQKSFSTTIGPIPTSNGASSMRHIRDHPAVTKKISPHRSSSENQSDQTVSSQF